MRLTAVENASGTNERFDLIALIFYYGRTDNGAGL
jgi:hypothetical protein